MKIKQYFLTGILALLPISLTLYFTFKVFEYLIYWSDYLVPSSFYIVRTNNIALDIILLILGYILSVLSTIGVISIVGALALNYFGKMLFNVIEKIIAKIPLSRTVYSTVKQISELVFSKDDAPYKQVILIEYPKKDLWSLGFLTNESVTLSPDNRKEEYITVFIPTAPNPTTGFLVITKRENAHFINMNAEDAIKFVISAGAIKPSDK